MYDTLIAFHILDLIQKSLERISFRFSDISCPDDFLLSESGMMKLDSICMKLTAIGESIKNLDKVANLSRFLMLSPIAVSFMQI
ncbi:antitoxin, partial [Phocaeicola sp.]|uniref:antitoxin n=1 Tax=Phocaeicola sp. TaxID=2773926 RepID=UPI003AAB1687